MIKHKHILLISLLMLTSLTFAQKPAPVTGQSSEGNAILTGVPFLGIAPDAVSSAMGDIGVATKPDLYSQHWNASKYAFLPSQMGFSLTYTPWLQNLANDMHLLYLTGYYKLDERSAISGSIRYFSMGVVTFRRYAEDNGADYNPNEYAIDLAYSRRITDKFSMAITGRYICSDLTKGYTSQGQSSGSKAAMSGAADVSMYYTDDIRITGYKGSSYAIGMTISNLGAKLSYSQALNRKEFLPSNLRIGGAYTLDIDDYNTFSAYLDLNKLLVPTPPTMSNDTIIGGMNNDVGVIEGAIQSFYDAPGGFSEELAEWTWALGAEYWYSGILGFRAGYFHESQSKGYRQYFTAGIGIKYNVLDFNVSYIIPVVNPGNLGSNPLKDVLRFSFSFNLSEYMKARTPQN